MLNTSLIQKAHEDSLSHKITFPDYIMKMIEAGVDFIYYDYIQMTKTCYSKGQDFETLKMNFGQIFPVGENFHTSMVKEGIRLSQMENLPFKNFTEMVTKAGCIGYHIFITGKKVVYYGRKGESHTEHFPS